MRFRLNPASAAAACLLFLLPVSRLSAQDIPTIGEGIGGALNDMYSTVRDGRILIGQFNADIAAAREAYWAEYPNGSGLRAAERRFAELLQQKDLHFLHESVIRQGIDGADALVRVAGAMMGTIDNGIPEIARLEFGRWAMAVRERAGPAPIFPRIGQALQETEELRQAYVRVRNRAEFMAGPRSPLRSRDPREYLIGVKMWGPLDGGTGHPTRAQAEAMYRELAAIVGEEALLAAGRQGIALPKMSDPFLIRQEVAPQQHRAASPLPFLDAVLMRRSANPAVAYLYRAVNIGPWVQGWRQAHREYDQLVQAHGQAHVDRAAEIVARAPTRVTGSDRRTVIDGWRALGLPSENVRESFRQLVALPPAELARIETNFGRSMGAREAATTSLPVVESFAGESPLRLNQLIGIVDGVPLALAHPSIRRGRGLTVMRPASNGGYEITIDGGDYLQYNFTEPKLGPDGALYGLLVHAQHAQPGHRGAVYRVDTDGRDFQILRIFEQGESAILPQFPSRVLAVDENGTIFGQANNPYLGGIVFRMERDGSRLGVIHEFPIHDSRGNRITARRQISDLQDGGDGYLYGVMNEQMITATNRFTAQHAVGEYRAFAFRLRKDGGDYQVLHRFSGSERDFGYFVRFVLASDGMVYGAQGLTTMRGSAEHGQVFRMNRDGSDFTTLYALPSTKPLIAGVVEGPGSMLYGVLQTRTPDGGFGPPEILRISTRDPMDVGFYAAGEEAGRTRELRVVGNDLIGLAEENRIYRIRLGGGS